MDEMSAIRISRSLGDFRSGKRPKPSTDTRHRGFSARRVKKNINTPKRKEKRKTLESIRGLPLIVIHGRFINKDDTA